MVKSLFVLFLWQLLNYYYESHLDLHWSRCAVIVAFFKILNFISINVIISLSPFKILIYFFLYIEVAANFSLSSFIDRL